MPIRPSRWVYDKFKDDVHFYFMLAAIPIGMTVACINLFVGPGELTPIPEGYVPREEEYHRNPVTRYVPIPLERWNNEIFLDFLRNISKLEYKKTLKFIFMKCGSWERC